MAENQRLRMPEACFKYMAKEVSLAIPRQVVRQEVVSRLNPIKDHHAPEVDGVGQDFFDEGIETLGLRPPFGG